MAISNAAQIVAEALTTTNVEANSQTAQSVLEALTTTDGIPPLFAAQNVAESLTTIGGITQFSAGYSETDRTAVYQGTIQVPLKATPWASPFSTISKFKNSCEFAAFDDGNGIGFDAQGNPVTANLGIATPTTIYAYELQTGGTAANHGDLNHFGNNLFGLATGSTEQMTLGMVKELAAVAAGPSPKIYPGANVGISQQQFSYELPMVTSGLLPFRFNDNSNVFDVQGNRLTGDYMGYIHESLGGGGNPFPYSTNYVMADLYPAARNPLFNFNPTGPLRVDIPIFCAVTNSDFWMAGAQFYTCIDFEADNTWFFYSGGSFADRVVIPCDLPITFFLPGKNFQTAFKPHFDNTDINNAWNNLQIGWSIVGSAAGWLIILADVANFGYPNTFIRVSPDWTKWWFIQPIPLDASSQNALNNPGTKLSIFVDLSGIFWLSTSNPHFFSSFLAFVPIPGPNPPRSISLPCVDPCTPSIVGVNLL